MVAGVARVTLNTRRGGTQRNQQGAFHVVREAKGMEMGLLKKPTQPRAGSMPLPRTTVFVDQRHKADVRSLSINSWKLDGRFEIQEKQEPGINTMNLLEPATVGGHISAMGHDIPP